jgi:hypothetical protein
MEILENSNSTVPKLELTRASFGCAAAPLPGWLHPFPVRARLRTGTTHHAGTRKIRTMQLKVSVVSDRPDEYIGKKGLVKNQVITCQDVDPSGYRLLMPFDYTMSEDEKAKWAGKLQDKQIVIGVRELTPFGGRLRARGAIITGPDGKN